MGILDQLITLACNLLLFPYDPGPGILGMPYLPGLGLMFLPLAIFPEPRLKEQIIILMLMPPPGDLPPVAVILFNPRGISVLRP